MCVCVDFLPRVAWLRIIPSAFTEAYLKSELEVSPALDFYLEAIDKVRVACEQRSEKEQLNGSPSSLVTCLTV